MKRIRLESIPGTTFDKEKSPAEWESDRVDYIDCIKVVTRAPLNPQLGISIEEMRKSLRVLDALEGKQAGDLLALEDEDHAHLCEKVRVARWRLVDERIVRFSLAVLDAKEWPIDATPEERG